MTSISLNPLRSRRIFKERGEDAQTDRHTDFPQRGPVKGRSCGTEDHRSPPRGLTCKEEVATDRRTDVRRSALASFRLGRAPFMPAESQEGEMEWNTRLETAVSKLGIVP